MDEILQLQYHDCNILQTFGTNKQAVVYKIMSPYYYDGSWCYGESQHSLQVLLEHF